MNPSSRNIERLPRESYAPLRAYAPPTTPVAIDLSDNTNQWGAPPAAMRALSECASTVLSGYPSQPVAQLVNRLARYVGIDDTAAIASGCGSDDMMDCSMRAFAEPGESIAFSDPTFPMVSYFARCNGLVPIPVPFQSDWNVNVDALLATNARLIYACAPNNPTGTPVPEQSIRRLLDETRGIVLLDEAYAEFSPTSWAARAAKENRLVVFRTLSKAVGLAGLRIGYAIGNPTLITELDKASGPYKVNSIAERIATAVFDDDQPWIQARTRDAIVVRQTFIAALEARGLKPLPSESNFVLVPITRAVDIGAHMRSNGVAVRAFAGLTTVGDALRITVGPEPLMTRCLEALTRAMAEA